MGETVAIGTGDRARGAFQSVSPLFVAVLAVLGLFAMRLALHGQSLATSLGDTDDATRLVQLRLLIEHGRWFDLSLPTIGALEPLVSHWSRLIDAGLASIYLVLRPLVGGSAAEIGMRVLWPAMLLLGLALLVVREAVRDAGDSAGYAVAGLMLMSATAVYQFLPGRIDHHNVQILCAVGGLLLLARAVEKPREGWAAGALLGLGLGVGLESMSLVAPVLAIGALLGLGAKGALGGMRRAALALVLTLATILLFTAPLSLIQPVCDAAAINLLALVAFGAVGVLAAERVSAQSIEARTVARQLGVLALAGGVGLAAYGWLNPACLRGPFGEVPDALWPLWLSQVTEGQAIAYLIRSSPSEALGFLALALAGLAARGCFVGVAMRQGRPATAQRREVLLFAAQAIALVAAVAMIKMMPYAAWLALPALARVVAVTPGIGGLSPAVSRIAALALLGQSTLGVIAGTGWAGAGWTAVARPGPIAAMPARTSCSDSDTIRALQALPPGLILADVNLGPYVVALTRHRVVSAPYHRLGVEIVTGQRLLNGPPGAAEAAIRVLGVDYVLACAMPVGELGSKEAIAFEDALSAGVPPSFLTPVALPGASKLRAYRVGASR